MSAAETSGAAWGEAPADGALGDPSAARGAHSLAPNALSSTLRTSATPPLPRLSGAPLSNAEPRVAGPEGRVAEGRGAEVSVPPYFSVYAGNTLPQLLSLVAQSELRNSGGGASSGGGAARVLPPYANSHLSPDVLPPPLPASMSGAMPRVVKSHES